MTAFSTKEVALLVHYLPMKAADIQLSTVPYELYSNAAVVSFLLNKNDAVYDASLRNCLKNFGKVPRPSTAWDALISGSVK